MIPVLASLKKESQMKKQKGFSLIELLIVVAIILIIAAIAIPNMMKATLAANQSGAAATLRTINTGEVTYSSVCAQVGYSNDLIELNTGAICAAGAGTIDSVIGSATGVKSGYAFAETGIAVNGINDTYTATATPATIGTSGQNQYCSAEDAIIRFEPTGAGCAAGSPVIGN
jgi:prepilin-type N-terminal cleavage/methylation domain-containing protein